MEHTNTTYLEVLTARQSLLSAQLSQTANHFTEIQSLINLYRALGEVRNKEYHTSSVFLILMKKGCRRSDSLTARFSLEGIPDLNQ